MNIAQAKTSIQAGFRTSPASQSFVDLAFTPRRVFIVLLDFFLSFSFFTAATWLSPWKTVGSFDLSLLIFAGIYSFSFCSLGLGIGFYEWRHRFSLVNILGVGTLISFLSLVVSLAVSYFLFYRFLGRITLISGVSGAYLATCLVHLAIRFFLFRNPYRFTILGSSDCAERIVKNFEGHQSSFYCYINWEVCVPNSETAVVDLIKAQISDVVVTQQGLSDTSTIDLALEAAERGFRVVSDVDFYCNIFERIPIKDIQGDWILFKGVNTRRFFNVFVKRFTDIVLSSFAIILSLPLMIVIAFAIKLTSKGGMFFNQPRMGQYCRPFIMYKFRTMKIEQSNREATGGFTAANDDRVTLIGRIIRPLHFDELPQLFNIFMGHMSIVGARPEALSFARKMMQEIPLYRLRYLLKPGLTGHAQLLQGYAMDTVEDTYKKLSYDLFYICFNNFFMDLRIMLRTVFLLAKRSR
ncbi:MAG: sugar transferase [Oligoflexales bacterium]